MSCRRQHGFALLELLFGLGLLAVSLGAIFAAMQSSLGLWGTSSKIGLLEDASRRTLDALCAELRWADRNGVVVTAENGSSRIDFRLPRRWDGTNVIWSTPIFYRVEASPIDANNNGVADDGRLVRVQDGSSRVVCERVRPGGFVITSEGDELQLELGLCVDSRGRLLQRDTTTSVTPRNRSTP